MGSDEAWEAIQEIAARDIPERRVLGGEMHLLAETLADGEEIHHLAEATHGLKPGLLAATRRRAIFTYDGLFSDTVLTVPWESVTSVTYELGRRSGELRLVTDAEEHVFDEVKPPMRAVEIGEFATSARARAPSWEAGADQEEDVVVFGHGARRLPARELIEILHTLRDAEVITPSEYRKLVGRVDARRRFWEF